MSTFKRSAGMLLGGAAMSLTIALLCASGCKPKTTPPPKDNRNVVNANGEFIGHLKPDQRAIDAIGPDEPMYDPVIWVVDGDKVSQPKRKLSVHLYRLDFDEMQPLTEAVMPFALMTEKTRQVVIHRGPPPDVFSDPKVASGERCLPIYQCENLDCPRVKEIQNAALFPHDPKAGEPTCPFCSKHQAKPYQTPQYWDMKHFMERKR